MATSGVGDRLPQKRILVDRVRVDDERPFTEDDEKVIKEMMESIQCVGLLNPITVQQFPSARESFKLVAGRKRLESHRRLKLKSIPARIDKAHTQEAKMWADLARIDENFVRGKDKPSAAMRAKELRRWKDTYETANPDAPRGSGGHNKKQSDTHPTFRKVAAKKLRVRPEGINQTIKHATVLGDAVLDRVHGTSLDVENELRALARMPKAQREALIERAVAGEKVSAKDAPKPPPRPKTNAAAIADTKAFLTGADDAIHQGKDALDNIKSRKHDAKAIAAFAQAASKVLAIWKKVADHIATMEDPNGAKTEN